MKEQKRSSNIIDIVSYALKMIVCVFVVQVIKHISIGMLTTTCPPK